MPIPWKDRISDNTKGGRGDLMDKRSEESFTVGPMVRDPQARLPLGNIMSVL